MSCSAAKMKVGLSLGGNASEYVHQISIVEGCPDNDLLEENTDAEDVRENSKAPYVNVTIQQQVFPALVDSGSDITCVSEALWKELLESAETNWPCLPVSGLTIESAFGSKSARVKIQTLLPITIGEITYDVPTLVVPQLHCPIILGADLFNNINAHIAFECRTLRIGNNIIPFVVSPPDALGKQTNNVKLTGGLDVEPEDYYVAIKPTGRMQDAPKFEQIQGTCLTPEQKAIFRECIGVRRVSN